VCLALVHQVSDWCMDHLTENLRLVYGFHVTGRKFSFAGVATTTTRNFRAVHPDSAPKHSTRPG
jgi:hypothetical protein